MRLPVTLIMNGVRRQLEVDTRTVLADLIREDLGLTGTHVGCRTGHCGACTVMLDGQTVKSCCVLAVEVDGGQVETVEGLASETDTLHPIQEAFVEHQGLQCGYCTPGMLMTVKALLDERDDPSEEEIRQAITGNLCRCTGYQKIVESVRAAAAQRRASSPADDHAGRDG